MSAAYLLLEDGLRFDGDLVGHPDAITGEVVFNTAMTGYQESVTDPSYAGQIIVFTYPLIGNYGVSAAAMESDRVHARGVIMREGKNGEDAASAEGGWLDWLDDTGTPGISGVDTRALVRQIRDRGAMRGGIFPAATPEAEARELIAAEPSMAGGADPFDLERPSLAPGSEANIALCDLGAEWTVGEDGYESRSQNSWCAGRTLTGRVLVTVAAGQVAFRLRAFSLGVAA